MRFQFIEAHREEYAISLLCSALEVSVSGDDAWRKRPMSQHQREDDQLKEQLQAASHAKRKVYGSLRLHAELQAQGIGCSRKPVARLLPAMGLAARGPGHRTRTTRSDPQAKVAPNLLQRDLTASCPKEKWVGDITAVWTSEGWLSLAAVLDLFSRRVGGWAMAATQDESLLEMALRMAMLQRRPQAALTFHSDRGCQHSSQEYQGLLAQAGVRVSMSRKGKCYDNAAMESFFGSLKRECVDLARFQSHSQARQAVFEYTECFYARLRRHSSLGYVSPLAFEQLRCSLQRLEAPLKWVNLSVDFPGFCSIHYENYTQLRKGSARLMVRNNHLI